DGGIASVPVDLVDALVRQAERDELGDVVVAEIPADRAGGLGQQLHDAQIGQRVGLQAAQRPRPYQAVEAGGVKLLDQRLRQALLSLDLLAIATDDRPQSSCGLHRGLSVDVGRQEGFVRNLSHWAGMFCWRSGGVKRYCRSSWGHR